MKTWPAAAVVIVLASVAAVAAVGLRRDPSPKNSFRVAADALPPVVIDRLRHPCAPTYMVSWDRVGRVALWRPVERR
ncbi:hypothetical protein [Mycolicibacterium iranicum]|uniref:Uncharacterized protein n=1 Tax=Mycolicibacterium iranicum TaxID=912594 RepID=A0ABT4HK93_MYCIR|nr:hypothetical protein [Mycolicibacterium iranicum]MCZ0730611.1 hypothetical protein [Mycolicibacterium iranicum]